MCQGMNCPYESRVTGECTGSWRIGFYPEDAVCQDKREALDENWKIPASDISLMMADIEYLERRMRDE